MSDALKRLDTLEGSLNHESQQHHFVVTEKTIAVRLRAVRFTDLRSEFNTTLVDRHELSMNEIQNSFILVATKDGEIIERARKIRLEQGSHPWLSHRLSVWQSTENPLGDAGLAMISHWVEESHSALVSDPFVPLLKSETQAEKVENLPPKPASKKTRVAKGEKLVAQESDTERAAILPSEAATSGQQVEAQPELPESQASASSVRTVPPPIREPYMPSRNPVIRVESKPKDKSKVWNRQFIPSGDMGTLINVGDETQNLQAQRQIQDEKHRTMHQKKPAGNIGNHAIFEGYRNATMAILKSALRWVGPVDLRVCVGKLCIKPESIPVTHRNRDFQVAEWSSLFNPKEPVRHPCAFTKVLSTNHEDMLSLLKIKLPRGKNLFEQDPKSFSVTFCLTCHSISKEQFTVRIGEDRKPFLEGTPRLQGALNWFFVRRIWDARKALCLAKVRAEVNFLRT